MIEFDVKPNTGKPSRWLTTASTVPKGRRITKVAPLHTNVNLLPGLSGLPERLRGKRLIMASAYEVYVDDSGSQPNSPIFFFGGFLSTVDRWAAFSNEWDSALALSPSLDYFKMSEAASFRGQFEKYRGWNEDNRNDRLVHLAQIINRHALLRASASIRHDLFEKYLRHLPAVERTLSTDDPHVLLAANFISIALVHAWNHGIREPIDFIFDKQDGYQQEFQRLWPTYKKLMLTSERGRQLSALVGEDPIFLDENGRKPLQAADFYAWQARNHYLRRLQLLE
jgi:hypothetical protein